MMGLRQTGIYVARLALLSFAFVYSGLKNMVFWMSLVKHGLGRVSFEAQESSRICYDVSSPYFRYISLFSCVNESASRMSDLMGAAISVVGLL